MLDGRWLYVATVPVAVWILSRRAAPGRRLVALIALAHVAILANVSLFPVPVDPAVVAAGRAAANASAGGGGLSLVPFTTIGPVVAGEALPYVTRIAILNVFVLTPAGVYLPLLFRSLRSRAALVPLAIAGGASVEASQLAISTLLRRRDPQRHRDRGRLGGCPARDPRAGRQIQAGRAPPGAG